MGGESNSVKKIVKTYSTSTVGDIGLTGANAVAMAHDLGQTAIAQDIIAARSLSGSQSLGAMAIQGGVEDAQSAEGTASALGSEGIALAGRGFAAGADLAGQGFAAGADLAGRGYTAGADLAATGVRAGTTAVTEGTDLAGNALTLAAQVAVPGGGSVPKTKLETAIIIAVASGGAMFALTRLFKV